MNFKALSANKNRKWVSLSFRHFFMLESPIERLCLPAFFIGRLRDGIYTKYKTTGSTDVNGREGMGRVSRMV